MRFGPFSMGGFAAGGVLLLLLSVAQAQQDAPSSADTPAPGGHKNCSTVDENGKTVIWPDCKPPSGEKSHASETPAEAASRNEVPAAKKFPFPGEPAEDSGAAPDAAGTTPGNDHDNAKPAAPSGLQDAGSSGNSSTSGQAESSSSSGSTPDAGSVGPLAEDDDQAARDAAARKAARHKLPPVARQSPDEREQEDLKVASFYMDDKNFRGAYSRASDAVAIAADDAEAHLALAEAARKLGKLDEALAQYRKCLTLDPVPKIKKAAEKAVKEMSGGT